MSKTTTAGIHSVERRLHTRHRARTTVYITTPVGRKKLCRAINLSAATTSLTKPHRIRVSGSTRDAV